MNASIKSNATLRRKRNRGLLFEQDVMGNAQRSKPIQFREPIAAKVRELAEQYRYEKRQERLRMAAAFVIGSAIVYWVVEWAFPYLQ